MDGKKPVDRMLTEKEVIEKVKTWEEPLQTYARLYLQMTPKQIDTPYRRAIFKEFGFLQLSPH